MRVGRRRKNNTGLKLEPRVYWKNGQWKYRHKDRTPQWEALGTDVEKANATAKVYNDPEKRFGTFGYFVDLFIAEARARRLHKNKSPRTVEDYDECKVMLKAGLGARLPAELVEHPNLIADFRNERSNPADGSKGAPVRANREMSLGSATFSWLIQSPHGGGLTVNPFELIDRNTETAKDRYVEDDEYSTVYSIAVRAVCMAMDLVYQTLQRPADVLALAPGARRMKNAGGASVQVLTVRQGKRGRTVDIEVTPDLDRALHMLTRPGQEFGRFRENAKTTRILSSIVHTADLEPYTVDGMAAMIRRYCELAGKRPFGLMDIRAKGATDMYLRGVPLETIQLLMKHKSKTTTEIYIKRHLDTVRTAQPNTPQRAVASGE